MTLVKTDVRDRAKVRANEEARAKRAFETLGELAERHLSDQQVSELFALKALLILAIRNQHLSEYARKRVERGVEGIEGY